MWKYGLIACFRRVIKFDGTVRQKLGVGKWKKIGVLAKTGNIGKKSSGRQYPLCKIPQHAEG